MGPAGPTKGPVLLVHGVGVRTEIWRPPTPRTLVEALSRRRQHATRTTGGYPYVLVRLEAVARDELGELLEDAWRVRAAKRVVAQYDADIG